MSASRLSIGKLAAVACALSMCVGCQDTADDASASETSTGAEALTAPLQGEMKYAFVGSSFPILRRAATRMVEVEDDAGELVLVEKQLDVTTTLHHLQVEGGATATALIEYRTHTSTTDDVTRVQGPPKVDPVCQSKLPQLEGKCDNCIYGVKLVSMTWVQTEDEKSAFTGAVPNKKPNNESDFANYFKKSRICTNGSEFFIHAEGKIIDTKGPKYQGKKGKKWVVNAVTSMYMTKGNIEVIW